MGALDIIWEQGQKNRKKNTDPVRKKKLAAIRKARRYNTPNQRLQGTNYSTILKKIKESKGKNDRTI